LQGARFFWKKRPGEICYAAYAVNDNVKRLGENNSSAQDISAIRRQIEDYQHVEEINKVHSRAYQINNWN